MAARTISEPLGARRDLCKGWKFCSTAPDECVTPDDLSAGTRNWLDATAPCTVADALQTAGQWTLDGPERRFDADDWWFQLDLELSTAETTASLNFDGLATLCEIWLNGQRLLFSSNMFVARSVRAETLITGRNVLHLAFRSLDAALRQRRARPRWRVPMIENQQLRWFRTTLLGRTPGWSLPAAPVGPWKPVWLSHGRSCVEQFHLRASVADTTGILRFSAFTGLPQATRPPELRLVHQGIVVATVPVIQSADKLEATLEMADVCRWWPHTHGTAALYDVVLVLTDTPGASDELSLGRVGFREIECREAAGGLAVIVNGAKVFCRGACWTPIDPVSLRNDPQALRYALEQTAAAGFNMLRISGTCIYENDEFFTLCDELGIMIWQDFMFASMDYPADDHEFQDSVRLEAEQQLSLWNRHACVAIICGNSEVSQQAAMWGRPREEWYPPLFGNFLRKLAEERCPAACYWPSSASGGDFPHQPNAGTCSYYGVGAYQRSLQDARHSGVGFATECLAFANIPEDATLSLLPGGASIRSHNAPWKRRSPRDLGAGWDFDDVRDHYLQSIFAVDAAKLRYADHARYLVLGRQAIAEAMTAAFSEWRRPESCCNGALVWFLRDMWAGAGWGIIDSLGGPKSPYFALRRILQPLWIGLTDEGLNGIAVHVVNETPEPFRGLIDLTLYRDGQQVLGRGMSSVDLASRSALTLNATSMLDGFQDLGHTYRFGPLSCDLIIATLRSGVSQLVANAYFLPRPELHVQARPDCVLSARAERLADTGDYRLIISSSCFARGVHINVPAYTASDQYFNVPPDATTELILHASEKSSRPPAGFITAINATMPASIQLVT